MPGAPARKLAVILHADVVGSTALARRDETLAHQLVQDLFRRLSETVERHAGTVLERRGDALVAEFPRASDAVTAAISFQRDGRRLDESAAGASRARARIGVALGEVVVADGTVTGPGVVVAQRIEQLAEAHGVCVSGAVREAVPERLPLTFKGLGDRRLKGFDEPVRVYRVFLGAEQAGRETDGNRLGPIAVSTGGDLFRSIPSIAVLPFVNLSGEVGQEYFADGMTEDIIAGLSRFRSLAVTARNSTFGYKGRSPDVRQVAADLGVGYVLEGSIRHGDGRVRVSAQLIDAVAGTHLWAERYERALDDIFEVQDDLTQAIVGAIAPEIDDVERQRVRRRPPEDVDTWGLFQQGLTGYYSSTAGGLERAIELFDRVNLADPSFAPAFALAAGARWRYVMHFDPTGSRTLLDEALEKASTAVKLDPRDPRGHYHSGEVHSMLESPDAAVLEIEEAIRLNPHDAMAHYFLGSVKRRAGRYEEAVPHLEHAMRLSPRDVWMTGILTDYAFCMFALERYDEGLERAQRARLRPDPRTMTYAILAATLSTLGRLDEARAVVGDLVRHAPEITARRYRRNHFGPPAVMERVVEALVAAGLPA